MPYVCILMRIFKGSSLIMKHIFCLLVCTLPFAMCAQHQLAYISTESGNFDIYTIKISNGETTQLTVNKGWDWSPKYITDSKTIFYYSLDTTEKFTYRLMNLEGEKIPEFKPPSVEDLVPSGVGGLYSYTVKSGEYSHIYLWEQHSGKRTPIITEDSYNGRVCWKKDGSGFAFISDRDGGNNLFYFDVSSGNTTRLTNDQYRQKYITWSPDSRFLAYTVEINDNSNKIVLLDLESETHRDLTDEQFLDSEISWSPDGGLIAFHSKRDKGDQIYLIEISNGRVRQLTTGDYYHGEPEWVAH